MKRCDEVPALPHEHGRLAVAGEHLNAFANAPDDRGADKYGFHLRAPDVDAGNVAVNLPAIRIALDVDIHDAKRVLRGRGNFRRQQDRTGASGKHGFRRGKLAQRLPKILGAEQVDDGGAFAAGEDQRVASLKIQRGAHLSRFGACFRERAGMRFKVSLQSEYADSQITIPE
jgi:hypothetical protein